MRRVILGVALAGVVASIAILTQSQLTDKEATQREPEQPTAQPVDTEPAPIASIAMNDTLASPRMPSQAPPSALEEVPARGPATATPSEPAPAPEVAAESEQDAGAAVLRRASTAYTGIKSLQANFVNKRENPLLSSTSTYRGTLYQKRPDKFLMKFSQPAGDVIVSDGRYFWLYYPSADKRQVLRMPAQAGGAGGVDLQSQFLGNPLTRFTHTYHGQQTIAGRGTHVLTLVPRQKAGYKSLKVWIDAKDSLVRRFILTENNGLVQEFTLSGLVVNPTLSNDLFAFTPPAEARIIEQP